MRILLHGTYVVVELKICYRHFILKVIYLNKIKVKNGKNYLRIILMMILLIRFF